MEKIPTAEEFLNKRHLPNGGISKDKVNVYRHSQALIDFTKLHVKAALETAAKKGKVYDYKRDKSLKQHVSNDGTFIIDSESILNAYPENLII